MRSKRSLNDTRTTGTTGITARTQQDRTKTNALAKIPSFVLVAALVAVSFGSWEALASADGDEVLVQEASQVEASQEAEESAEDPPFLDLFSTGPFTVTGGTEGTDYEYRTGTPNVLTIKSDKALTISMTPGSTTTTADQILISSGVSANITLANVNIDVSDGSDDTAALEVAIGASLNLTLSGTNSLRSSYGSAGLQLDAGADLTITKASDGSSLAAASISVAAGIGGGSGTGTAGDITILGGTVVATGGFYSPGAGIGGGYTGSPVGDITISGGSVTATAGPDGGAGIGGGYNNSPAGSITISGGSVTATGDDGSGGAGIGGGAGGSGIIGNITISGSSVTAIGGTGSGGAGIGGGDSSSSVGDITITDSTIIQASGGSSSNGAGIGGGNNGSSAGNITISGGSVTATGGSNGAGIGAGNSSPAGNIAITDGAIIEASGGANNGAGIGGGLGGGSTGNITITDSTITKASGSAYSGAGIGGGNGSPAGDITITDSTVTKASGSNNYGAGIGGGLSGSSAGNITISGGSVTATGGSSGGAGIGGGNGSSAGNITISGGSITATGGASGGAGIGAGFGNGSSVSSITISGGSIEATATADSNGGGAGIGAGYATSSVSGDVTISGGIIKAIGSAYGAGIGAGGGSSPVSGNIIISGGTIAEATGGSSGGAGIGGGANGTSSVNNITISGGTIVKATGGSGSGGAGIGGGSNGPSGVSGNITISGGTITEATGGATGGAGIGGGADGSPAGAITISGGTITAAYGNANSQDIGNGVSGSSSDASSIIIDGGSVYPTNNAVAYGSSPTGPANSAGDLVFCNTLTLGSATAAVDAPVTAGVIDGVDCEDTPDADEGVYGIKDVRTDASSEVFLWLPNTGGGGSEEGGVGLTVGGTVYEFSYSRSGAQIQKLPAVTIDSITPDGTAVALDGEVVITFSTAMDTGAAGTVVLRPDSGESILLDPTEGNWSENDTVYTISYHDLAFGTRYTIAVTGFKTADVKSGLDSDTVSFTTRDSYMASIDPTSKKFGPVTAGYTPPEAQQFTLTNEGTGILTGLTADIIGDDSAAFDITADLSTTINPKGTATLSVQPAADLPPRDTPYEATLHITGANNILFDITLSLLVTDTFEITINPSIYYFDTGEEGYAPARHAFTITNTGTGTLDDINVFLEGPDVSSFALSSTPSPVSTSSLSPLALAPLATHSLAPGQQLTVEAYPVAGLAARDTPYTAGLRVTASNGIDLSAPLSFTVKAPSGGGGGGSSTLPQTGDTSSVVLAALALGLASLGVALTVGALRRHYRTRP